MRKSYLNPSAIYAPPSHFTQAIRTSGGDLVFVSGLVGFRPDGSMPDGIVEQAEAAFENLRKVIRAAGGDVTDIVKVNIYVAQEYARDAAAVRDVRARFFTGDYPVSTLVQVAGFASPDYLFEIEAIAVVDDGATG